jgi:hypothetical protein
MYPAFRLVKTNSAFIKKKLPFSDTLALLYFSHFHNNKPNQVSFYLLNVNFWLIIVYFSNKN